MRASSTKARSHTGAKGSFTLLAAALSGCLLVTPLGDFEESSSHAGAKGGASTGGDSQGGTRPTGGGGTEDGGHGNVGGGGGAGDGGGGDGGGAGDAGCTTNRDCVDILGMTPEEEPARCRPTDHTCVPLKTPECLLVYGDPSDEDAVFLGGFADIYDMDPKLTVNAYPLELAVEQLNNPRSTDSRPPGLNGAQVVVTVCDNSTPSVIQAGMDHLANDIGVPGVVATLKPGDLMSAFASHDDVLFLSPVGRTNAVTDLDDARDPDHDLIWNLFGLPSDYAGAYVELLGLIEQYSKNRTIRDPERPLRVSLVIESGDAANAELGNVLRESLVFNDAPAADQGGPSGTFQVVTIRSTSTTAVSNAVTQLIAFIPDVVISAAGSVFTRENGILRSLETNWESAARPFYVLSPYNVTDLGPTRDWLEDVYDPQTGTGELDANSRFLGLWLASPENPDLQNTYQRDLGDRFDGDEDRIDPDTGNYYDAMYLLAYAAYGGGLDQPLTGRRMADGLERLLDVDATPYEVGPGHVRDILEVLDDGGRLAFRGTLGPPDFVDAHRQVTGALFCYEIDSEGTATLRRDVLRYVREENGGRFRLDPLLDEFPCFDNFFP
jgi:hypothetical protein